MSCLRVCCFDGFVRCTRRMNDRRVDGVCETALVRRSDLAIWKVAWLGVMAVVKVEESRREDCSLTPK